MTKPRLSKAEWVEQKRAEQREKLEGAVRELMSGEGWQRWLETRAKFYRYSFYNTLLIAVQKPGATNVAGARKWQNEFKRHIIKGEKAIWILAPLFKNVKEVNPETGKEEEVKKLIGWKDVPVFDISQTDGEPLPEPPLKPLDGDSHAEFLPMLEKFAETLGSSVSYMPINDPHTGGWFEPDSKRIVIKKNTAPNQQVHTLIHEIAHALGVTYTDYTREDAEVIVESATYIAARSVGLDTGPYALGYIGVWGQNNDLKALQKFAKVVDEVAAKLEAAMALKPMPKDKNEKEKVAA